VLPQVARARMDGEASELRSSRRPLTAARTA
jgi:hypothetical protein